MMRNLFIVILVLIGCSTYARQFLVIVNPVNDAIDIPIDATITKPAIEGINGYVISLASHQEEKIS